MKKYLVFALTIVALATACGTNPLAPTTPSAPPPVVPTAAPAPAGPSFVSLNYDETNNDPLTPGQSKLIATYFRNNGTQAEMEQAIQAIQQEASRANATVKEGESLTLPRNTAWLVWCANTTDQTRVPTDVSDVYGALRKGPGKVWIQVPFASGVPLPSQNTFSACNAGKFWAVAVH